MKVATRITVAVSVVVAVASASYAVADLRARDAERQTALEREARALSGRLRASLEATWPTTTAPANVALEDAARALSWKVSVIARTRLSDPPSADLTASQQRRLRAMIDVPVTFADVEGDSYFQSLPLKVHASPTDEPQIVGMVEIARPLATVTSGTDDILRAIALVAFIVAITTLVVGGIAIRMVSRPIAKLLGGIDDVAKGDLSHVILSEHDDELGAIASRFNDMTTSLRDSRGETQRQNEAKLALEQRLGQTEKLATIGQLAAEIAHEVGTPLNVIAGRARSIQRKLGDADAIEKNAGIIAEQTARITRIIKRLLDFTRRKVGTHEHTQVVLDDMIAMTLELLAGQLQSARVRTVHDRGAGVPGISGDLDRLQQVVINMVLNAVQAMPDGGVLVIGTGVVTRTRPGLEGSTEQRFVSIEIRDSGVGIPPEIREKIFDPFYTTKVGQGGTGLGLAVCSGIVKEHDGWIDLDDAPGGGTVFTIYLPETSTETSTRG